MQLPNTIQPFIWKSSSVNNCNTYLIDGPVRVLIDPGHSKLFNHVQDGLLQIGINLDDIGLIICTHAHPDHIEAVELFQQKPALITLYEEEWQFLKNIDQYISTPMHIDLDSKNPDFFLKEGEISIKGIELKIIHTPGQSPGSVSI